jgi:hypothetical protein
MGEKHDYGLKIFLGYQRTLEPRGVQTLKRGKNQKK